MALKKKVLLTGHEGYIGSVMTGHLLAAGYEVIGLDTGYFTECTLTSPSNGVPTIRKDLRDLTAQDVSGAYAVVHLAALSNDPIGNLNDTWTKEINCDSSARLAELARTAGVRRFLFSSSCIMYGMSGDAPKNEDSPLDPRTEYARSKVKSEQLIRDLAADGFSPTFMRNETVYGLSPRMRFDTVLNSLVGSAFTTERVVVQSDGKPWRPVVHVQDVARAFVRVLAAREEDVHNQAFNTGVAALNYQVLRLAEIVVATVPGSTLEVVADPSSDQRSYVTDFSTFTNAFPDFEFKWTPETGARELYHAFERIHLSSEDFCDKRFTRLKWLRHLLESGQLDESLRWQTMNVASAV